MANYLCLPDLQSPFEHSDALRFCSYLKRHYKIPDDNVINLGDEVDQYWGGLYKQSPDALHSAKTELKSAREHLRPWYDAFPRMMICESNHGTRWKRKALDAQIPSEVVRLNKELFAMPDGWRYQKHWIIETRRTRFMAEHGDDWGGQSPHVQAAIHNGVSTIMGHHHSLADTRFVKTSLQTVWAVVSGCLIDFDAYAFEYARRYKFKPIIGATVILNDGKLPFFIPIDC